MAISAQELRNLLRHRYPNADLYVLDTEYNLPTRNKIVSFYKKFQRALKLHKLLKWVANVFDCDDFAWSFKGGVNGHVANKGYDKSFPVGFLCFFQGGDRSRGHAINCAAIRYGNGMQIVEIEPQPKAGIFELTQKERESVWLVIV